MTSALADPGLPPDRLELEITETVLLENGRRIPAVLHQLKSLGISIVLDDFGTGYSSLSYLTMFPFDKIKIDKSFIQNMTKRADCAAIISATLTLGQKPRHRDDRRRRRDEDQFRFLRLAGVTALQGYLFKRPGPAREIDFAAVYGGPAREAAA